MKSVLIDRLTYHAAVLAEPELELLARLAAALARSYAEPAIERQKEEVPPASMPAIDARARDTLPAGPMEP